MPDFRIVLFYCGSLLAILGASFLAPLSLSFFVEDSETLPFLWAMLSCLFVGLSLIFATWQGRAPALEIREGFLLLSFGLCFAAFFGALPFIWGSPDLSFLDALFESVSGLTTTGATILAPIEDVSPSILLWRALLNWLGGFAFIAAGFSILPRLRVGGMHVFRLENADKSRRTKLRYIRVISVCFFVYALLSTLLCIGLAASGMSFLDAVCHTMSAISTGGFSTASNSVESFSATARALCAAGMLVGSVPFILFLAPMRKNRQNPSATAQVKWLFAAILASGLALALWEGANGEDQFWRPLGHSLFTSISIISTTGYLIEDYAPWGGFAQLLVLLLAFVGGCTGSAAGGIKIFRFQALFAMAAIYRKRLLNPNGVFIVKLNQTPISEETERSVLGFMLLYCSGFALLALALAASGLTINSALAAAASALGNLGPALDPLLDSGGYSLMPNSTKALLCGGMILGRLEIAAIIILFSRNFWRI